MKWNNSGVQARILEINPRAFFTPCVCRNYNLVLGDMKKPCAEAMTFFGTVQHIHTLLHLLKDGPYLKKTCYWSLCEASL